jgi:hypothetical protein
VVDVVDEAVQRADALGEAALDVLPLGGGQDARDEVQREGAVADRTVLTGRVEGDALLQEDRVAAVTRGGQQLGPQTRDLGGERDGVRPRDAPGAEDLVEVARRRLVGGRVVGDQRIGQGGDPLPSGVTDLWIVVGTGRTAAVRAVEVQRG